MSAIKVMVVDDSAVVRQALTEILGRDRGIDVIGAAADPLYALDKMAKQWPDVIVTDVEMPRMDGLSFVRKVMSERPTPMVVCSSLTERGAEVTMDVLAAGAVSIVTKPKLGVKQFLESSSGSLVEAVKGAANARVARLTMRPPAPTGVAAGRIGPKLNADAVLAPSSGDALARTTERVIAIGTSTGGTQALEVVLTALPRVAPGIVVVQHMPEKFTAAFAARLNSLCQVEVREAQNNDRVLPGRVLIAPGGRHMVMKRSGAQYYVEVVDGPLVNRHKPSVDVLFRSVAKYAGKNALGVIMTGMGDDGAAGLKEMLDAGARTIGQDEATCVVYGMPAVARQRGAVGREVPLQHIAGEIMACQ